MEEVDEFGIPIKKQATTEVAVDEFGIPVKKKELTTTTSQSSTEPVQQPVSQRVQPSLENGAKVDEPAELPQSYQSDRGNYKELVGGKKYNLLRGGKPITGTWDETTQTFIKDPLLNITPQQKKEVGFLQAVEAGVNLETPVETQEEMFGRVGVDIDNLKTDARQKISNIEYTASYPSVQRLAELDKLKQSTNDATVVADIDKQIEDLRSKKMNDKEFTGVRFDNSEGKVYQNTLPTKPFEEFKGDVKKLPKTDLTVGQAYDEIKDDSDYVQQVQSEISGYNNMVNQYMISKLPEETKAKLEAIKGTPEYDAELERELVQSKNIENVIPALTYGLDKKLDALMEVGSNLGLDDDKLIQKKLGDIREKELFGKTMASTRAELASSIGGMLPDLAAGAVWSPLMLASMASTMPNDFLEQSIAEQSQSGEPIDVAKAKKFALTSTAAQTGMLVGAGKLGSHGLNLVSKTALKRAGELIYEMAKRGTKDAIVFGGLGTVMQNKINKAYDLSENDEYLKSALHMAVIGGMFALKEGLGKVGGVTKKASNEVDYLASYLPEEYTKKQVEQLVALGKTTAADGEETLDKLNTYRTIRNQLPVDLSMGQMEKIYPLWQQKREIHNMVEGASSEFKSVLNGQVEDIDRKILIEAAIPLTSAERMEKSKLTTGEAEGKQIDKARLRYLEKRDEAAKEAKKEVKEAAQAEEVKPTETEPKPFTRERQPQEVGETETIVSKPASGQVAETVGDAHLKVSADVKTALDNGRKKQVVSVDKDGNQIVYEVDFTKDDADVELDRLEALAARGKLTEQEFLSSFFGQATDTATFAEVKRALKSDAVGFIKKLRQSFEGGKVEQPPVETETAEVVQTPAEESAETPAQEALEAPEQQAAEAETGVEQQSEQVAPPVTEVPTAEVDGGVKKTITTKRAYEGEFREGVKTELEKLGLTRDIESQAEAKQKAKDFIATVGEDAALEAVRNNDVADAAGAYVWNELIESVDRQLATETDPATIKELQAKQAMLIDELSRKALSGGRFASALGDIYKNSDLGYNVDVQIGKYKEANGGEISPEVEAKFKEIDNNIKELNKRIAEAEAKQAEIEAKGAVENIKETVVREKKKNVVVKRGKDLIAEGLDELVTALGGKKMAVGDRSPSVSMALEKIGKGLIDEGAATLENVAKKVKEYVEEKYPNKLNFADYEEGFADNIAAAMAEETTTGKVKISKNLIRRLVGEGITDVNELVKAVKEQVADKYPDATDREIRDAITGYGKTSNPNKEEIEAKVRKLKNLGRVISGLEDVAEGKRPLKSGFQRDKPDVEVRAAQKELREAMKDLPIDAKTLEGHLKTALDSIKQRLSNQIEDFNREIKTGEETPKNERTVEYDEDANWLKEERDRVKAIRDEIFGKSELTDEQRIDIATKALEKSIERKKEMLGSGDIMPKPKASKTPETPELKRLRTENEILQDEINALRKKQKDAENPPKTKEQIATENAIEANKKSIEEKERRIRENDLAPKPSKEVADKNNAELKSLRTKNGLLDKQLQKLRNDAKQKRSAEEIATENKIKALERKAADIQDKIKKGELEAVKKESKVDKTNPKYIAAKNKAEAALEELKKLQKVAGIPEKRRLDLTKKATERRIADLKRKLKEGDFAKKAKKPLIADTELIQLKAEKLREQEKYDKEVYKAELENRTKFEKAKDGVWEAWGLTRLLSATADFSFIGVQGLTQTISHPIEAAKALKNALTFFGSEKKTEEWLSKIKAQDFYPVLKESGLALTEPKAKITAREESFYSGWTNMVWDALGVPLKLKSAEAHAKWKALNPFKAFERSAVGYLDTIRVARFLDGMEKLQMQGKNVYENKQDYKDVADAINTMTGRSSLKFGGLNLEQNAEMLSKVFFSPRNWASQLKTTLFSPAYLASLTPTARKMAAGDIIKQIGITTGMMALTAAYLKDDGDPNTSVEMDPRSSDFMKIKLGKKRIDPWGGKIQMAVLFSRLAAQSVKTGSGDVLPLGTPYKTKTTGGLIGQQAVNKLAPSMSVLYNFGQSHVNDKGERVNEFGQPYSVGADLEERLIPIYYQTLADLYKDDPNALNGLLAFGAFLGAGVNVYEDKVKKEKTKDERPKRPERPERPKR